MATTVNAKVVQIHDEAPGRSLISEQESPASDVGQFFCDRSVKPWQSLAAAGEFGERGGNEFMSIELDRWTFARDRQSVHSEDGVPVQSTDLAYPQIGPRAMRGWRTGTTRPYFGTIKFRPQAADNAEAMVSARPLLVRDVMTAAPTVLHVTHSLGAAQHLFDEEGVQALPVIRGRKVVGSISARDVADLLAREPDGLDRRLAFAMGQAARVVRDDAPVAEAARLLADEGIHFLPVVDADGNLLGLVTSTELLRVLARLLDSN